MGVGPQVKPGGKMRQKNSYQTTCFPPQYGGKQESDSGFSLLEDAEDFLFAQDQVLVAVQLNLRPGILAEQNTVTRLDVRRHALAVIEKLAGAHGFDFALLRLLFSGIGNDDASHLRLAFLKAPDENAVVY